MCSLPCLRSLHLIVYRGNVSWPFKLIMKCSNVNDDEQLRTFRPSSDFILLQSKLPRLLVEVNSKPKSDWPEVLVGMLLMGCHGRSLCKYILGQVRGGICAFCHIH